MPEAHVGDVRLVYDEAGDGFPLVLISGTGLPASIFALHIGWMAESRRVIAFDNRDNGRSSFVSSDYTPADMSKDVMGLMDALGIDRADVLGFSLGGAVAQEVTLAAPDRVRGLVLYATWARTDTWLGLRFKGWEGIAQAQLRDVISSQGALDLFTHRFFADPAGLEMFRAASAADDPPPDGFVRQWRADQAHDAKDRLGEIRCPTLVVGADEDTLVPRRYSEELASLIPGARLEIIAEAGHGALLERPDAWRAAIEPFLAGLAD